MTKRLRLTLRAGERIFVNGAILRADRKVSIELLNAADFLLEQHVIDAQEVTSLPRHLYYCIQSLLLSPFIRDAGFDMCQRALARLERSQGSGLEPILIERIARMVSQGRPVDALKELRAVCSLERPLAQALQRCDRSLAAAATGAAAKGTAKMPVAKAQ